MEPDLNQYQMVDVESSLLTSGDESGLNCFLEIILGTNTLLANGGRELKSMI